MFLYAITSLVYGICIFGGGLLGYLKAASLASLVMGASFGFILTLSAFLVAKGIRAGVWITFSTTLILNGFFFWRFYKLKTWIPSGVMLAVSVLALALLLFASRPAAIRNS